jgi:hypothetical protein
MELMCPPRRSIDQAHKECLRTPTWTTHGDSPRIVVLRDEVDGISTQNAWRGADEHRFQRNWSEMEGPSNLPDKAMKCKAHITRLSPDDRAEVLRHLAQRDG